MIGITGGNFGFARELVDRGVVPILVKLVKSLNYQVLIYVSYHLEEITVINMVGLNDNHKPCT